MAEQLLPTQPDAPADRGGLTDAEPTDGRPDLSIGAFTPNGPWTVDPDAMAWRLPAPDPPRRGSTRLREDAAALAHELVRPQHLPSVRRVATVGYRLGWALLGWGLRDRGTPTSRLGTLPSAAPGLRAARPDLHQAGADHLVGRGDLPRGAGGGVPAAPRPGAARAVRDGPTDDRGGPGTAARRGLRLLRPRAHRLGLDRPGARGHPPHRRAGRGQGPATAAWPPLVRLDIAAMAWIAPQLVGRIPIAALTNPPALVELFAETIVEELDFRLEAQNMLDIAAVFAGQRPALHRGPPAAPRTGHPAGTGHGAPARLRLGRRRRHAGGRHRHRRRPAVQPDRLPGGRPALRRVPRRPARRQPAGPDGRDRGPARLRHHRPPGRAEAPGLPAPADGGHHQQPHRAGRGPAGPRRPAGRLRRRGSHPRPRTSTGRPSTPPPSPPTRWWPSCAT